jgi:nucleoid-associated protein YgaU
MDYEYASDDHYGGRVLWGRMAVYGVTLLLAFLLGSCVGGWGQVDRDELTEANKEIARLQTEVISYEETLEAMSANAADPPRVPIEDEGVAGTEGDAATGATEGETAGDEADDTVDGEAAATGETRTYTVQEGDTLYIIAQRMYGDGQKFPLIAEANDLSRDTPLRVGNELVIPPES